MFLNGCSVPSEQPVVPTTTIEDQQPQQQKRYVKGIWFTYYELQSLIADNQADFESNVNTAFSAVKDLGFNTVTVQVRPFADAFYYSSYFPSSTYCTGIQGAQMLYDPLAIMCSIAHSLDLKIEAWINPYRVSNTKDFNTLSDNNMAKVWYSDKSTKHNVIAIKSGIYYNPASLQTVELIVNGVREIVTNYDIDAIHFDDYFYPTTNEKVDKYQYQEYISSGGDLCLADWRRGNVDLLISSVYSAIKEIKPSVEFGISPASNIKNDYSTLYADVEKWVSNDGYVDYICPQIYFGFKNVYQPFMFTTKKWIGINKNCKLYVGLPLYKCGKPDKYAAQNEEFRINEFVDNKNIISRQISYLTELNEVEGYYVFSYSSLFDEACKTEVENMKSVMQNSNLQ